VYKRRSCLFAQLGTTNIQIASLMLCHLTMAQIDWPNVNSSVNTSCVSNNWSGSGAVLTLPDWRRPVRWSRHR
jgi:hypothetical protein